MEKNEYPKNVLSEEPQIHESAFVAPGAIVIGDVVLGEESSVWYNSVLRGDINQIVIGDRSNIQDGVVCHVENDRACIVGEDVVVGHKAILHGCTIENGCLIGMGAIVLNGVTVKKGAVIGAGAVVKENTTVGEYELWVGIPAKCVKTLTPKSYEENVKWAAKYSRLAKRHTEVLSEKRDI